MKVDTTELPGSKVELQITAEPEDIDRAFAQAYERLSRQGQVPGFRPGKAPAALVKRRYDEDTIRQLAWGVFVQDVYLPVIEDSDLRLLVQPDLPDLEEVEDFAEGQTMELKMVLTVHPRPRMPDYKSLKLLKPSTEVSDEEVDDQLEELRQAYAEEIQVDRDAVAEGDVVRAEVQVCRADSEEIIEEATSQFIADREGDQPIARKLAGHILGQTVTDETTVAADHEDDDLAGQKVIVKATIKDIKERQLPELDDEFAAKVDEQLESLEALRDRIREQLGESKKRSAEQAVANMAVGVVAAATDIDLPEELVNSVTASEVESYMQYLQQEGVSAEQALQVVEDDEGGVVSEAALQAKQGLQLRYIFQEIVEAEELEISDDEVQDAVSSYAQDNNLDEQMVRQAMEVHEEVEGRVRNFALRQKVIRVLVDNAEIEQVPWEGFAVRARKYIEEYPEELRQTREDLLAAEADEQVVAEEESSAAGEDEPELKAEVEPDLDSGEPPTTQEDIQEDETC